MMEDIKQSLVELGLSHKEIDVYLSMLELGPSSVQDIAKKAGVNRSTTYVMIEGLKKHGLVSTYEKGKKVFFNAENPDRLVQVVNEQIGLLSAKRERVSAVLPRLLAIFNASDEKPKVRFFEGDETIDIIRMEVTSFRAPVWNFFAVDENLKKVAAINEQKRIELSVKVPGSRVMMAIKPGVVPQYMDRSNKEIRTIGYEDFPFSGEITIVADRVYIVNVQARSIGFIVENKELSDLFRALYQAAWNSAKPWTPPEGWKRP
jgi:predicted DNA-binding transcriptional regulator